MAVIPGNVDTGSSYLVIKHSWKGKYKRIFTVRTDGITTYNPNSMEATNSWLWADFVSIAPSAKTTNAINEFQIVFRKGKKHDNMRFSSEYRAKIITDALTHRHQFAESIKDSQTWFAYKYHWSDQRHSVVLRVAPNGLEQLHPSNQKVLASYFFSEMENIFETPDYPGGFVVKIRNSGRLHLFASEARSEIIQKMMDFANHHVGVQLSKPSTIAFDKFVLEKFGKHSSDDISITSISEFTVHKQSSRHSDPVRRTLCLTETCLLERDPATYAIVTLTPLKDICALIRHVEHSQLFSVEYTNARARSYTSTDRDSLLASLIDGVRGAGNRDVHVKMTRTELWKRLGPLDGTVEEEVESSHLRFLISQPVGWDFSEAVSRFNANVSYSGLVHAVTAEHLFAENKEKLISGALGALINREGDQDAIPNEDLEQQFHALRRLVASKAGFASFTILPGFREKIGVKVVKALKRDVDGISHAAIDMLCALMEPMHEDYDLKQEQLNKSSLLSSEKFLDGLLDIFAIHVSRGTGALVVAAMLDMLTFALCAPYSETTDGKQFDVLLEKVASRGRSLYRLFQHPSLTIVKGAGLLMKAIIEEGSEEIGQKMQLLALAEGALPKHLLTALFTKSTDGRLLTHCQLSRHLVGLWVTGNEAAMQLLKRILPAGLLLFLTSELASPTTDEDRLHVRDNLKLAMTDAERQKSNELLLAAGKGLKVAKKTAAKTAEIVSEKTQVYADEARRLAEKHYGMALQHWKQRMGKELWKMGDGTAAIARSEQTRVHKNNERPIVLRKRREHVKSTANWGLFYYEFSQDHARPNLIWNYKTRQELQDSLESEIQAFAQDRELSGATLISWNFMEYEVRYQSLAEEIKIGDYFLRLLLEEDNTEGGMESRIDNSYEFFNDLYHRFLLTPKTEMKCLCLQAMTIVYGRHFEEIGFFHDTKYIVAMLERTTDRVERDRLLLFLNKLILNRENANEIVYANGIRILVDLLPLAHLHTSRAIAPSQTIAIEASPDSTKEHQEKEWYYGNADKERNGPISFAEMTELFNDKVITGRTKVWAQGLEGWRLLQQVAQLKWTMLAKGQAVLNESEMAALILGMLITVCRLYPSRDEDGAVIRPLPKVKALLSDPLLLPHTVQLLLTFDPVLVEKVAQLLHLVMEDNPKLPTLYLTGVFYFVLMYTGANLLPIGRFLAMTHTKQAFRSDDGDTSEIRARSILGQLIPEAMVAYLENHGPEKFAQIFLGEFDTPEAIWNNEMRQLMIQKIACHLADFTPRLRSNTRALYQYCPIPLVSYPRLEFELFCDIYYLRNLCDLSKFPDWPIKSPLKLLKEVLLAWKAEVEKKPSSMTTDDAFKVLGLNPGVEHEDGKVRKAYFKMAQRFHPDKNPQGREMFEKVNMAYEFLCSRTGRKTDEPDPENIVLILRAQSILFLRYSEVLHPYKYAGYPMLIKTIRLETADNQLFSKSAPLLAAAAECAYYTVKCSALNAEELRRENGLEALYDAYERCVSVLSQSSKPDDVAVQVCTHITRCYAVASQFEMCRDRMVEMPELVKNICRMFFYKQLTALCAVAAECVSSLAVDNILQMHLLQAGVLWHLLTFLFDYDFTLEEGGVETQEETSLQAVSNKLAKLSAFACARLAGLLEDEELKTPPNPVIKESLCAMITPYVVYKLSQNQVSEVLKLLTSNTENPYLMWDNRTRSELTDFLEEQRTSAVRRGVSDPSFGSDFKFSIYEDELVVGDIFVRIYNRQPMFQLENPKRFTVDLLSYLNNETQYLYSLLSMSKTPSPPPQGKMQCTEMALEALANVIKHNNGVEIQCIGHFKLLFCLLRLESCPKVQELALSVISNVTGNAECVDDIAANGVMMYVLLAIYSLPEQQLTTLDILHALMSDTRLVKECLAQGVVICLLSVFCCAQDQELREKAAEVLSKMALDKLVGPKVRILLSKFLPEIFLDAMRKSPETCVQMYEGSHENPELIWNDESRNRLNTVIKRLSHQHSSHMRDHPDKPWQLPEGEVVSFSESSSELVIAGIYLRLFIANPGWVLRKPREFLSELLETVLQIMSSQSPNLERLETVTMATVRLLEAQPALCEIVPATGYIARIFTSMKAKDGKFQKAGVLIIGEMSRSSVCVEAMAKCECIPAFKRALKLRKDLTGVSCEVLSRMFQGHHDTFVHQALECGLLTDLLALLDSPLMDVENPSATKALIVKALKAMQTSLAHGDRVTEILKKSSVWAQYEQQKHDLFITDRPTAGYLTNSAPGVAGYLTSTTHKPVQPTVPPPMDTPEGKNRSAFMDNPLL